MIDSKTEQDILEYCLRSPLHATISIIKNVKHKNIWHLFFWQMSNKERERGESYRAEHPLISFVNSFFLILLIERCLLSKKTSKSTVAFHAQIHGEFLVNESK